MIGTLNGGKNHVVHEFLGIEKLVPDPMLIANEYGHIVYANHLALDLFGFTEGELINRKLSSIVDVGSNNFFAHHEGVKCRGHKKNGLSLRLEISFQIVTSDYEDFLSIAVHSQSQLTEIEMIADSAQLSNKVQVEQQILIEKLHMEIDNKKKELESFSYSVSHDLRSPLRGIQGFASMFVDRYYDEIDNEGKRLLKKISANVEKMERQMDEMVSLYRIGIMDLCFTSFAMNELTDSIIKSSHKRYEGTKIVVGSLGKAYADVNLIRQVLINLISNAAKFSEGSKRPEIEIGCLPFKEESHFYVRDNGVGFDDTYSEKLFGIFQRLHDPALYSGLGVGLAIVKQIVSRHNGRVWAIGKENEGATFYFSLPHRKDNSTM